MKYLAVKNFDTFQHYRDRNPPWIKLYGALLVDLAFLELPEAAQAQLVKLWILASQIGNPLPNNPRLLSGKIGSTGKFHLAAIIASGFLIPCNEFASTPLAESAQESSASVCARNQRSEVEDVSDGKISDASLNALYLTIWSNKAVTERWGEQPNAYIQANAIGLYEALAEAGVDWRIARLSIYAQCRESKQTRPPRGQNYFRRGILEAWEQERARRAVAASGEQVPDITASGKAAPKEHWKDKLDRENAEESERKRVLGNVSARRARTDGDLWWARMQNEAGTSDQLALYAYAFKHIDEAA